jgi:hypothetical protein
MKSDINPMQRAKRCHARCKRTKLPCKAPVVTGWSVCRMHGAGGGAPEGKANGNYRHGGRTKEVIEMKRSLSALVRETRRLVAKLD